MKRWWTSKTVIANVVGAIAMLLTVAGVEVLDAEAQAALVGGIMVVVNFVLRFVTEEPIG